MNSEFDPLEGATVFTKLHLHSAYHLVWIYKEIIGRRHLNSPLDRFEYLVIPFILTNTPAVYHNLVNNILKDNL